MRDIELYRHLLGLEQPWFVSGVELDVKGHRVDVQAGHAEGVRWPCPVCSVDLPVYDHSEERAWRHLDSCQFMTYLHARPPRVKCPDHGVHQVKLPWAEPRARFTALFERLAIDVLKETDVLGATRILRISWDEAWYLMERAVRRGLATKEKRVVAKIGIDEKAAAKGHKYLTLVCDLERACVEYVGFERKKESLDLYFQGFSGDQLAGIEAIAMDMWEPYFQSAREYVPEAGDKIVFDRYHIMGYLGKAVDTVRKREHRALRAEGDETLTGSKYLWLYSAENLPEIHQDRFAELRGLHLKTARAWAMKESFRDLWRYRRLGWATRHWKRWYFWATHSRLQPVIDAANTIKRHLHNVMTYFAHRITNAVSEGLNSKIQTIKKMACGFRNRENFKTAIYFHCGGLDLYPVTHGIPG
jgi:transposase